MSASSPSVKSEAKIVIVGDGAVGKSCFFARLAGGRFPLDHAHGRECMRTRVTRRVRAGEHAVDVTFDIVDTEGQAEYDRVRPLAYKDSDLFVVAFSVASPSAFAHVQSRWWGELRTHCPHAGVVLLATKSDLRSDPETVARLAERNERFVSAAAAQALAGELGARACFELSSLTEQNLEPAMQRIFELACSLPPVPASRSTLWFRMLKLLGWKRE